MEPPTTVEDAPAAPTPPPARRRRLDGRAILVSVGIALVAAVIAGLVTVQLLGSDDTAEGTLTAARPVPTRAFERFDGTKGSLADYQGQRLVVNFFSSTCAPCKREMPDFEAVARQAGDEVTFVGIDVQDSTADGKALVKRTGVTYDIGQDFDGRLFNDMGATLLPATAFVAADGTVMEVHTGRLSADELRDKISTNLLAGG